MIRSVVMGNENAFKAAWEELELKLNLIGIVILGIFFSIWIRACSILFLGCTWPQSSGNFYFFMELCVP